MQNKLTTIEIIAIAILIAYFSILMGLIMTQPQRQEIQDRLEEYNCRVLMEKQK